MIRGVCRVPCSFLPFSAAGYRDLFSSLPVDKVVFDDRTKDFGDAQEDMIAESLYYAANGGFSSDSQNQQSTVRSRLSGNPLGQINRALDRHGHKGMYVF